MAYDARRARPTATDEIAGYEDFGLKARFGEHVVTAVAIAVAISVVALIAVLMGSVGP